MRIIYNIFFPVVFLFFIPGMVYKLWRRPGWKKTFWERFGIFSAARKTELKAFHGCIWVHAVSVGETMIALAMLEKWRQLHPERKFVLSTTTTTGQALARDKALDGVAVIFCPIDFISFVRRALKLLKPVMLVIFETEIWPNMLAETRKTGAKVALVNGRMSDKSSKGYYRFRLFFRPMLECFNVIGVQILADMERYRAVAPRARVEVRGNMKFDQQAPKNLTPIDLTGYFGPGEHQILLAASTHPGEEKLIADVFTALKDEFPNLKLIVVPRHAERGNEIEQDLRNSGVTFQRRSRDDGSAGDAVDCLLADTTGEMLGFMQAADVVVMGKSLAGHVEGHNLVEPALLAKPIVTGAALKNFRFILNVLKNEAALGTIDTDNELESALRELFRNPGLREELGGKARQAIAAHRGATENAIKLLEELL